MEIIQIVAISIIAVILAVVIRQYRPELALQISVVTGLLIFLVVIFKMASVLDALRTFTGRMNIDTVYISTIFRIVGIAYIAEFGAQVCKDAGENSIASKIELAGKVIILVLAVPILMALMELIMEIIP
ncbi:MAG: stage III sporulation protein AD [Clostridiales bacterium]|nr:stage III sporulation protein AD [Clostridiales bacterium]HOC09092.1 stage III sporulation protein AD [Bacillota bacterium]HQA48172.1 stage III sporulation protein AD [Bacillota bacterium]